MSPASEICDRPTPIIVDCTAFPNPVSDLIAWVSGAPCRRSVHVYMHSPLRDSENRVLQNTLRVLGCRVTLKVG